MWSTVAFVLLTFVTCVCTNFNRLFFNQGMLFVDIFVVFGVLLLCDNFCCGKCETHTERSRTKSSFKHFMFLYLVECCILAGLVLSIRWITVNSSIYSNEGLELWQKVVQ